MTSLLESRALASDLELRAGGDGRTIVGTVVPFDEVYDAGQFREVFRHGAFTRTLAERGASRVKLLRQHDDVNAWPIGVATLLREDPKRLYGEFRLARSSDGDDALDLIRDGILDGLSVGFVPMPSGSRPMRDGTIERTEVALRHVGLVGDPAYMNARVTGIRSTATNSVHPSVALARLRLASI
jgi:HK97 family phage prohead protease